MQRQQAGGSLVADAAQGRGAVHDLCVDARETAADGIHCGLAHVRMRTAAIQRRTEALAAFKINHELPSVTLLAR